MKGILSNKARCHVTLPVFNGEYSDGGGLFKLSSLTREATGEIELPFIPEKGDSILGLKVDSVDYRYTEDFYVLVFDGVIVGKREDAVELISAIDELGLTFPFIDELIDEYDLEEIKEIA